jgi:hypothetical protein
LIGFAVSFAHIAFRLEWRAERIAASSLDLRAVLAPSASTDHRLCAIRRFRATPHLVGFRPASRSPVAWFCHTSRGRGRQRAASLIDHHPRFGWARAAVLNAWSAALGVPSWTGYRLQGSLRLQVTAATAHAVAPIV